MDQKAIVNFLVSVAEKRMYVEFVQRCTLQSFLDCHKRAFYYLGGVPAKVLYDNMKYVVIRRDIGQVYFKFKLLHFSHHCGFTPKACSPYSPWVKGKVERPVDYIRESFWRGYGFNSIEQANRDLFAWLDTVANTRVHASHRQAIAERWQKEKASLRMLPPSEYDTSLKIFRMVLKNCLIRFDANWYKLPHAAVGKMIRLKIKDGTIRFFDDDRLLASYPQAAGKYQFVGNPLFSELLKADREQSRRKYGRFKGQATRGLSIGSLFPQVMYRPIAEYERMAEGGGVWTN